MKNLNFQDFKKLDFYLIVLIEQMNQRTKLKSHKMTKKPHKTKDLTIV